jgi:hypothetical protein
MEMLLISLLLTLPAPSLSYPIPWDIVTVLRPTSFPIHDAFRRISAASCRAWARARLSGSSLDFTIARATFFADVTRYLRSCARVLASQAISSRR